ncbi:cache domain-containing sensor histidine kinase [Enterococcus rivorum]|uniref:HAMP domain-containing protein n=1 Tax=Enterococcus rivorum TaxID=762845 RepID=A0A1E5KXG9_9ENTE|nr:sensor histidine kinase [Enterococcus rivorum]MBP2099901.1 two-component system sensor histidine kinase YesM [Enterococcus rivorum]OEH82564.1 hypothetical protein BCR26_13005 [Enterococcus rivorum]
MNSLQKKLTLYASGFFIILFLSIALIIKIEMERTVLSFNRSMTQQLVDAKSEQISYWFEQRINEIQSLSQKAVTQNWSKQELIKEAENLAQLNKNSYESIRAVSNSGESFSANSPSFSIVDRDYFKKIITNNSEYVISKVLYSHSNQAEVVIILYRIPSIVDSTISYLAAAVPIEQMNKIAKDIFVYDGTGTLTLNHNQPKSKDKMVRFERSIQAMPDWKVQFQVPEKKLYQSLRNTQNAVLIVGTILGIFFLVWLYLLATSILKPVKQLQGVMGKVAAGDESLRVTMKRTDEFGQLGEHFNQMLDKVYETEQEKKEIELRMIQEQVKPHFLYNTLDTIQWLAASHDADDVVELIEALSLYFRLGLNEGKEFVPLSQEFKHLESYLKIQQVRYEKILNYEFSLAPDVANTKVIRFLLQPLVENAIYHGIKPLPKQFSTIWINATNENNQLKIAVINDGLPISKEALTTIRDNLFYHQEQNRIIGFGLYSVYHRLKLTYGKQSDFTIESNQEQTKITITIPLEDET